MDARHYIFDHQLPTIDCRRKAEALARDGSRIHEGQCGECFGPTGVIVHRHYELHAMYAIRAARPDDLAFLNAIELAAAQAFRATPHAFAADFPPLPLAELETAQSAGRLWVAADSADAPAAFAIVHIIDGAAHIHELDVHPDHSRRGLGARLIATICAWAAAHGYPAVTLSTFSDVPWNAPYYARLGFAPLTEAELGPELRALRAAEGAYGLPLAWRVCMRRGVSEPQVEPESAP